MFPSSFNDELNPFDRKELLQLFPSSFNDELDPFDRKELLQLFPSSFNDELDPFDRKEHFQLVKRIEAIEMKGGKRSRKKVFELLNEFSSKYLMTKNLWDLKIRIIEGFNDVDTDRIASEYVFHFGDLSDLDQQILNVHNLRHKKLCKSPESECGILVDFSVEEICYPHDKLEEKWRRYEICVADALIPKAVLQKYEKMRALYYKIVAVKEGTEEWIKALVESDDYEFIVDNVEFRLFKNLGKKELWKLYIHYLQTKGHYKKLLETYSKYCRYFLEDFEMLEEYQKAAEKYGPSLVPWKNPKSFEIYDKMFFNVCENNAVCLPVTDDFLFVDDAPAPTCYFNPESVSPQKIPFQQSLLNYILDNATAAILFDLFKTCKWFYANFPVEIIYSFDNLTLIGDKIEKQSIKISHLNRLKLNYKIYVSTVFRFNFPEVNALTDFMPNIYRCSAKYVDIKNQNLTFNELKFLIGHGEVVELNISAKDENGNPFKFEDIITLLPKIQRLYIQNTVCSANITQILCNFPFENKIENFSFGNVCILPDPNAYAKFILKNASRNINSRFSFSKASKQNDVDNVDVEYDDEEEMNFYQFLKIVNAIIGEKWVGFKKPYFLP